MNVAFIFFHILRINTCLSMHPIYAAANKNINSDVNVATDMIFKPTHCIKFLGLYIDERLVWPEHINACRKKLTSVLYAINNVNHFLQVASLKLIYYTLVYPYLTYGIILWGSTYKVHTTKFFIMQKKLFVLFFKQASMNTLIPFLHT